MRKLYIYVSVIVVVLTTLSYLLLGNKDFTRMVFFTTVLGGVLSIYLAKKSFKSTKGMEDY
jgi:hypothetical protein